MRYRSNFFRQIPLINEHLFYKYFVRLSVGNATKGFATYGCCHPCFIIKEDSNYFLILKKKAVFVEIWYTILVYSTILVNSKQIKMNIKKMVILKESSQWWFTKIPKLESNYIKVYNQFHIVPAYIKIHRFNSFLYLNRFNTARISTKQNINKDKYWIRTIFARHLIM